MVYDPTQRELTHIFLVTLQWQNNFNPIVAFTIVNNIAHEIWDIVGLFSGRHSSIPAPAGSAPVDRFSLLFDLAVSTKR